MRKRVAVTGLGMITPVGTGKEKFWRNLSAGISGIAPVRSFDCSDFRAKIGAEVKDFDPLDYMEPEKAAACGRLKQFAFSAAKMAVLDAGLDKGAEEGIDAALCMGATIGSHVPCGIEEQLAMGALDGVSGHELEGLTPSDVNSYICSELGIYGAMYFFHNACASGNYSIGCAYDLIMEGKTELAIAGGVDTFSILPFAGFNSLMSLATDTCRPFDKNRKGLVLGEGAGVLVLEDYRRALERGAHIYAELSGYGLGMDSYHITSPSPTGYGAEMAMKEALDCAGLKCGDIDYICAHGTGTVANDKTEAIAIGKTFGNAAHIPPVSSIKSMTGHSLGAASAIEAAACCLMIENSLILPTMNFETPDEECNFDCVPNRAREKRLRHVMSNAFAFGGNTSSIILSGAGLRDA